MVNVPARYEDFVARTQPAAAPPRLTTALLCAYGAAGQWAKARAAVDGLREARTTPSPEAYVHLILACSNGNHSQQDRDVNRG